MAFKMNPSGIRKNPMQKLQGMGWLNSPIKQTQEEIDAIAKENAMNNGLPVSYTHLTLPTTD